MVKKKNMIGKCSSNKVIKLDKKIQSRKVLYFLLVVNYVFLEQIFLEKVPLPQRANCYALFKWMTASKPTYSLSWGGAIFYSENWMRIL